MNMLDASTALEEEEGPATLSEESEETDLSTLPKTSGPTPAELEQHLESIHNLIRGIERRMREKDVKLGDLQEKATQDALEARATGEKFEAMLTTLSV